MIAETIEECKPCKGYGYSIYDKRCDQCNGHGAVRIKTGFPNGQQVCEPYGPPLVP